MTRIKNTYLAALAVLLSPMGANAAVVTHGNLSSDDSTNIIEDSVNNRRYTRLDAFDWTVAQTQAQIGSGGLYDGWSIMTSDVADDFVSSILGVTSTACDGQVAYGAVCGFVSGWTDANFGASYTTSYDFMAFINTNSASEIGLLRIRGDGRLLEFENWGTESNLDLYNSSNGNPINLMLYQDIAAVPEPGTLALLGLGLAGIGFAKRKKA